MGIIGNRHNRLNKKGWRLSVTTCNAKAPAYYHISSRVRAFVQKNIPTLHSGGISSSWSLLYEYLDFNGKMNGEMKFSPCMSMS